LGRGIWGRGICWKAKAIPTKAGVFGAGVFVGRLKPFQQRQGYLGQGYLGRGIWGRGICWKAKAIPTKAGVKGRVN